MSKKILIVDDSMTMVRIVSNVVKQLGFTSDNIITANDGEEGFKKFQENDIDIVLSDINMPVMDGYGMIKQIREIDKKVTIFFITTEGGRESVIKGLRMGVNNYIVKPFDAPTLKKKLEDLL